MRIKVTETQNGNAQIQLGRYLIQIGRCSRIMETILFFVSIKRIESASDNSNESIIQEVTHGTLSSSELKNLIRILIDIDDRADEDAKRSKKQ